MGNFNELVVWQKSIDFIVEIYRKTSSFPEDELYGLRQQMRRAAVSVASNLAEGQGRFTVPDYRRFVILSRGSAYELQTQIIISDRLGYLDAATAATLLSSIDEIAKMLNGLLAYLTPSA